MISKEFEVLWTVCSNLETLIKRDDMSVPQAFHDNLTKAFAALRAASSAGASGGTPDYEDLLLNLLAVVHRDGGQYTEAHGVAKASSDAEKIVANYHAATPPASGVPQVYKEIDRMSRELSLLAMELARFCLKSHSLQVSERDLAIRIRDICYTLLGTKNHKAKPNVALVNEFASSGTERETAPKGATQ